MKTKLLGLTVTVLFLAGCLGGSADLPTGTLALHLGDTAIDGNAQVTTLVHALNEGDEEDLDPGEIAELWIAFKSIEARRDGSWEQVAQIDQDTQPINLMDLRFRPILLAETEVNAGTYTDLRFITSDQNGAHEILLVGESERQALAIPSEVLKMNNVDLRVESGIVTQYLIDVNPHYFTLRGRSGKGFNMNPVHALRLVPVSDLGAIDINWDMPPVWKEGTLIEIRLYDTRDLATPLLEMQWESEDPLQLTGVPIGEYRLELTIQTDDEIGSWTVFQEITLDWTDPEHSDPIFGQLLHLHFEFVSDDLTE